MNFQKHISSLWFLEDKVKISGFKHFNKWFETWFLSDCIGQYSGYLVAYREREYDESAYLIPMGGHHKGHISWKRQRGGTARTEFCLS